MYEGQQQSVPCWVASCCVVRCSGGLWHIASIKKDLSRWNVQGTLAATTKKTYLEEAWTCWVTSHWPVIETLNTLYCIKWLSPESATNDWIMAGMGSAGKTTPALMTRQCLRAKLGQVDGGKQELCGHFKKTKWLWLILGLHLAISCQVSYCTTSRAFTTFSHASVWLQTHKIRRRGISGGVFFLSLFSSVVLNRNKSIALSQLINPRTFPLTLSKLQCAIPRVRPHSSRGLAFAANVRFNSCHIQPEERHSRCHIPAHVQPLFCKSVSSS